MHATEYQRVNEKQHTVWSNTVLTKVQPFDGQVMKQIIRWLQAFLILSTVLRVGGVAGAASRKCGNAKDLVRF